MKKVILVLISAVFITAGLVRISKIESFQFFGELVTSIETSEKVVALTFDDGPSKGKTEEVLKILRENDIKATFYLVGKDIAKNPGQARLIVTEGHEVGNHSYTHERMIFKSPSFVKEEIERTSHEIRNIGYSKEISFRPPYGRKLFTLPYYLSKNNILTVTWDVEPDSALDIEASSDELVNYALEHTKPGSIILMHVMFDSRKRSMESIPGIIQGLKSRGYRFVTVSQLLDINEVVE